MDAIKDCSLKGGIILDATRNTVDAVLTPDDASAGEAISVLEERGLIDRVAVVGSLGMERRHGGRQNRGEQEPAQAEAGHGTPERAAPGRPVGLS